MFKEYNKQLIGLEYKEHKTTFRELTLTERTQREARERPRGKDVHDHPNTGPGILWRVREEGPSPVYGRAHYQCYGREDHSLDSRGVHFSTSPG
tara:strand:- start:3159 stop:3440 length:282 start_codon:yes stop_codon:yes gene_type:complete